MKAIKTKAFVISKPNHITYYDTLEELCEEFTLDSYEMFMLLKKGEINMKWTGKEWKIKIDDRE